MTDFSRRIITALHALDDGIRRLRLRTKRAVGRLDPLVILPYRSYGSEARLRVKGRVLENKGITAPTLTDSVWINLINMYRRFESDEIPGARVRASYGGRSWEVVTDREGFFDLELDVGNLPPGEGPWRWVDLELIEPRVDRRNPALVRAAVRVPTEASFGVISDLDDTVIQSSATEFLAMLRLVLLHNAYTRLPFEGVASFYAALERGTGEAPNPIFYVSSSPWNLYDLLEDFLEHQGIPAGPLLLKDWSLWNLKAHTGHKLGYIRRLLEAYPRLPFVLIGDSGERDPEIYLEAVRKHPGRFRAVYIRDVVGGVRAEVVRKIAAEVEAMGVPMLLVSDTVEAARHAESLGLILPQQVEQVAEGAQREAEKPSPLEVALGEGETRDP